MAGKTVRRKNFKEGSIAPYSVTLGIFGLMFHTHFTSTLEKGELFAEFAKLKIDEVFKLYDIPEEDRDDAWKTQLQTLIQQLAER